MAETVKTTNAVGQTYTTQNLEELQKRVDETNANLKQFNTDAAKDEDLRARAEAEYKPTYNAQVAEQEAAKKTAQSAYDTAMGAYERQYNRDAETLGRTYDNQAVATNNNMLARGFNNSSLAVNMLNHVNTERNRALQNLQLERQANENQATAAYNNSLTAAEAAIARLAADLQTNIDSRYQALKDADQQRVQQNTQLYNQQLQYLNDLAVQIESLRQQGYSQYLQQQEMEKAYGGGSSGGGSSSKSYTSTVPVEKDPTGSSLEEKYNSDDEQEKQTPTIGAAFLNDIRESIQALKNAQSQAKNNSASSAANAAKKAAYNNLPNYQNTGVRTADEYADMRWLSGR